MGNTVNSREPILGLEPIDPLTNLNLNPTRQSISGSLSTAYGSPTFHQGSIPTSVRRIMGDNYHPEYGPNFVNEQLAANQTKGGQLFNAMSQAVVGQILGGAIQGVGYLLDLESIGNLITGRSDDFTNSISEIGLALQNKVQDAAPIYRSADAKKFDIGSFSWWMQNAPSLVSTVSLMFPAMGIVRGLEAVAKLAKIGEGIGATTQWMLRGLTEAVLSRQMESMQEVVGQYKQNIDLVKSKLYNKYTDQMDNELNALPLSHESTPENPSSYTAADRQYDFDAIKHKWEYKIDHEAKVISSSSAATDYWKQWIMLIQDIPQYLFLNTLGNAGKKLAASQLDNKVIKRLGLNPATLIAKRAMSGAFDIAGEGGEEIYQYLIEDQDRRVAMSQFNPELKTGLLDVFGENIGNGDMWTNGFFGALGAGFMHITRTGLNNLTNHKAIVNSNKVKIADIETWGDRYNLATVILQKAKEGTDPTAYDAAVDNYVKVLVSSAVKNGNSENLKLFIKKMAESPDEEFLKANDIDPANGTTLKDNPEIADKVIKGVDRMEELYKRFAIEAKDRKELKHPNKRVTQMKQSAFIQAMAEEQFSNDNLVKRRDESNNRLTEKLQKVEGFVGKDSEGNQFISDQGQQIEINKQRISALDKILKQLKKYEKRTPFQASVNKLNIADTKLKRDQLAEANRKLSKERSDVEKVNDAIAITNIDKNALNTYIAEGVANADIEAALNQSNHYMMLFRKGEYLVSQELIDATEKTDTKTKTDIENDVLHTTPEDIKVGDKVAFEDENGNPKEGIVSDIDFADDNPQQEDRVENMYHITPLDDKGNKTKETIIKGGVGVTLAKQTVESKDTNPVDEVEEELSDSDLLMTGLQRAIDNANKDKEGITRGINNLSYVDNGTLKVRNTSFDEVISDPKVSLTDVRAHYFIDVTSDNVKQILSEINDLLPDAQKTPFQKLIKGIKLTESDIATLTKKTPGDRYTDFVDVVPIAVNVVIDGKDHTGGMFLQRSSNPFATKVPQSVIDEGDLAIKKYYSNRAWANSKIRSQLIIKLLNGQNLYSTGLTKYGGRPNNMSKELPQSKRSNRVDKVLGVKSDDVTIAINKTNINSKEGYYKGTLMKANGEQVVGINHKFSSPGSVHAIVKDDITGQPYALKLNTEHVSAEHADILFTAFFIMGVSEYSKVTDKKTGKESIVRISKKATEEKLGIVGRYSAQFKHEDTRVSGLRVGELIDLLIVSGRDATDPDSKRYSHTVVNDRHRDALRNKRIYLEYDNENLTTYLIYGAKDDGTPNRINLNKLHSELEIDKKDFIKWMTENKRYAIFTERNRIGAKLGGGILRGREFRIGNKHKFVHEEGQSYQSFFIKNKMVSTDVEPIKSGSLFHMPFVDLNMVDTKGNLAVKNADDKPGETIIPKPIKHIVNDNPSDTVKDKATIEAEKVQPKLKKKGKVNPKYENRFNSVPKRRIIEYINDKPIKLTGIDADRVITAMSDIIEVRLKEGKSADTIFKEVMHLSGKYYFVGMNKSNNEAILNYIKDRKADITSRTLVEEFEYGSTLKGNQSGTNIVQTTSTVTKAANKEFIPEPTKRSARDIMNDFKDPITRSIDFKESYTTGNVEKEVQVLADRFGITDVTVTTKLADLIRNGHANWALYSHDAITVYEAAEEGTLYHEAFHRVSLGYLTENERRQVYRHAKDFYKLGLDATNRQIEEKLAEGFRVYVLRRESQIQTSTLTRFFKGLLKFIKSVFVGPTAITEGEIEQMFKSIYEGKYENTKVLQENIDKWKEENTAEYESRMIHNREFFSIDTRKDMIGVVKSLSNRLFTVSGVENINDVGNLNYEALINDIKYKIGEWQDIIDTSKDNDQIIEATKYKTLFKEILGEPTDILGVYSNFVVFQELIEQFLSYIGIRNINHDKDNTNIAGSVVGKDSWETSTKENALASTKFTVALLHEGTVNPRTGFDDFVDFESTWNRILHDLHLSNTTEDFIAQLYKIGREDVLPYYIELAEKLEKGSYNLRTQFLVTFNKYKNEYTNFIFSGDSRNGITFTVSSASYYNLSRDKVLLWNEQMHLDPAMWSINESGERDSHGELFDEFADTLDKLSNKVEKQRAKGPDEKFEATIVKDINVALAKVHITLDDKTLLHTSHKYNQADINDQLLALILDLNKSVNVALFDKSNIISNGFISSLGDNYAEVHPEETPTTNNGPGGNQYYVYSEHNEITKESGRLAMDVNYLVERSKRVGNKHSIVMQGLVENPEVRPTFGLVSYSAMKRKGRDKGRKLMETSPVETYMTKMAAMGLLHRGETDAPALLPIPQLAERNTYYFLKSDKILDSGLLFRRSVVSSDDSDTVVFKDDVLEVFYGYYLDEWERIQKAFALRKEYSEEKDPKQKIILKAKLVKNYHYTGDYNLSNGNAYNFIHFKGMPLKDMSGEDQKANVKELISNILNDRLRDEIKYAVDLGLIKTTKSGLKTNLIGNTVVDFYDKENTTNNFKILSVFADFLVNSEIGVFESEKLFLADPAFFKRNKTSKTDVSADLYKRWFGAASSGSSFNLVYENEGPSFNAVTFNTQTFQSSHYENLLATHTKLYKLYLATKEENSKLTNEELTKKATDLAKSNLSEYLEVDPTDGQSFISPEMYKSMMNRLGRWDSTKDDAYNMLLSNKELSLEDEIKAMSIILNPIKTVYFGHSNFNDLDLLMYDKMSMAVLFPRLVKDTHLADLLDRMMLTGKYANNDNLQKIYYVKFDSAVKVGGLQSIDFYKDGEKRTETTDFNELPIFQQSFDNLYHQTEVKSHERPERKVGTQLFKVAASNIDKTGEYKGFGTGQDLLNSITHSRIGISNLGKHRIAAMLGFKNGQVTDKYMINVLKSAAIAAGKSDDFTQALRLGRDGLRYLELDAFSDRKWIYSRLTSIVNKETIDITLPGKQLVQVSDYGMSSTKVGYDNDLSFMSYDTDKGKFIEMECRVTVSMFKDIIPNYDKLSPNEKKEIIENKITILGYRIPTQGQNSTVLLKVKEILPESAGDVVHLPLEFTALTGSDFDIDKLFTVMHHYDFDKKSKSLVKVAFDSDNSEDGIQRRYDRKALELLHIYRNNRNIFSDEEWTEFSRIKRELRKLRRDRYIGVEDNELRKIAIIDNKLDLLYANVYKEKSEEKKKIIQSDIDLLESRVEYLQNNVGILDDAFSTLDNLYIGAIRKLGEQILRKEKILPTYEEFKQLSIEEQNSRKAAENHIIDAYMTVLRNENHFIGVSSPLGASTKQLRDEATLIDKLEGGIDSKELKPLQMGSPKYQNIMKSVFSDSKGGRAPSVLQNGHHSLTQQTSVKLHTSAITKLAKNGLFSLDGIYGEDGRRITDWLSALIDAHVDAVKDPYIVKLNVNEITYNITSFMIRTGFGKVTFDFLSQPILKQYTKEKFNESEYGISSVTKTPGNKTDVSYNLIKSYWVEKLKQAYKVAEKDKKKKTDVNELVSSSNFDYSIDSLMNRNQLLKDIDSNAKQDVAYIRRQLSILDVFSQLNIDAKKLNSLVMASRIDTEKFGSTPLDFRKFHNAILSMEEANDFVNADKIINSRGEYVEGGTSLPVLYRNSVHFITSILGHQSLYSTEGFNLIANTLLSATKLGFNSSKHVVNTINEEIFSYLIGKFFADKNVGFGQDLKQVRDLFGITGKNDLFQLLADIKAGRHEMSEALKDNTFISSLTVDYSENKDVLINKIIKLAYRSIEEVWTTDDYTEGFADILNNENKQIRELGHKLLLYAFYTSGMRNSTYAFSNYIPNETRKAYRVGDKVISINEYIKSVLKELTDPGKFIQYLLEAKREVFQNNWFDEQLVPHANFAQIAESVEYLDGDNYVAMELNFPAKNDNKYFLGSNKDGVFVFMPYILVEVAVDQTLLVEYMAYNHSTSNPIYRVIPKKGFYAKGLSFKEYGLRNMSKTGATLVDRSVIPENNPTKAYTQNYVMKLVLLNNQPHEVDLVPLAEQIVTDKNPIKDNFFNVDAAEELRQSGVAVTDNITTGGLTEPNKSEEIVFKEDTSIGYAARTHKNASADATIAIAVNFNSAGEKLTKASVNKQGKKYIPIDANNLTVSDDRIDKIVESLNSVSATSLNIAGNGIYTVKGKYTQAELDSFVYESLNKVINHPDLNNAITSVRTGGQTGADEAGAKAAAKLGLPTIVLAPKGWKYRIVTGQDIANETSFKSRFNVVLINKKQSKANIPQNLVSGKRMYGTLQEARPEVKKVLGDNPHSIDMIEAGFRTRTTRSAIEMYKYNIKVGDIVKQFGKSADGSTKTFLTKVIAIYPKGSKEWASTWYKEGWTDEGFKNLQRFKSGAAAIEFEVINVNTKQSTEPGAANQTEGFKHPDPKIQTDIDKYGIHEITDRNNSYTWAIEDEYNLLRHNKDAHKWVTQDGLKAKKYHGFFYDIAMKTAAKIRNDHDNEGYNVKVSRIYDTWVKKIRWAVFVSKDVGLPVQQSQANSGAYTSGEQVHIAGIDYTIKEEDRQSIEEAFAYAEQQGDLPIFIKWLYKTYPKVFQDNKNLDVMYQLIQAAGDKFKGSKIRRFTHQEESLNVKEAQRTGSGPTVGFYFGSTVLLNRQVFRNDPTIEGFIATVFHEVAHVFTNDVLGVENSNNLSKEEREFKSEVIALYNIAADRLDPFKRQYGFSNVREFVAVFMQSEEFANQLKNVFPTETNFSQRFWGAIMRFLHYVWSKFTGATGVEKQDLYNQVKDVVHNFISLQTDIKPFAVSENQSLYNVSKQKATTMAAMTKVTDAAQEGTFQERTVVKLSEFTKLFRRSDFNTETGLPEHIYKVVDSGEELESTHGIMRRNGGYGYNVGDRTTLTTDTWYIVKGPGKIIYNGISYTDGEKILGVEGVRSFDKEGHVEVLTVRQERALRIGNSVHRTAEGIVKDVSYNISEEYGFNISSKAKLQLKAVLNSIKKKHGKNAVILSELIVADPLGNDTNGVAGTIDLLVIDKMGRMHIYDIKTSERGFTSFDTEFNNQPSGRKQTHIQLSIYKHMIEKELRRPVQSMNIIMLQPIVEEGKITSIQLDDDLILDNIENGIETFTQSDPAFTRVYKESPFEFNTSSLLKKIEDEKQRAEDVFEQEGKDFTVREYEGKISPLDAILLRSMEKLYTRLELIKQRFSYSKIHEFESFIKDVDKKETVPDAFVAIINFADKNISRMYNEFQKISKSGTGFSIQVLNKWKDYMLAYQDLDALQALVHEDPSILNSKEVVNKLNEVIIKKKSLEGLYKTEGKFIIAKYLTPYYNKLKVEFKEQLASTYRREAHKLKKKGMKGDDIIKELGTLDEFIEKRYEDRKSVV